MPEIVSEVGGNAFYNCSCQRNVAFPPNAVFGDDIFIGRHIMDTVTDLQLLFRSELEIIRELQRFNELPIHSIVYYQSYNQGVLQNLAMNMESGQHRTLRSKLDPTVDIIIVVRDCLLLRCMTRYLHEII